jgi:hypothetical protein
MAMIKHFVFASAAVLVVTACAGKPPANNASTAPTRDALLALEKSAYEAWKSKDVKFWDTFLADKFVGYGASGKLDKASATKEYSGADCEIRSYALSDEQMKPLGNDAALITYKSTVDGTCGGQTVPAVSWAAGVYVRDGDQWRTVFHAEDALVDPKAAPASPVDAKEAPKENEAQSAARDAITEALFAVEKVVWEAWKDHDAKKLEALTASDISFINIFGVYLATKAEALKNWSGEGCDVKSVSVTDAAATMLSPTVGILTFNGAADGTCYGQMVGPIWGTSIYVKDGDKWKWTFGINVPARRAGA